MGHSIYYGKCYWGPGHGICRAQVNTTLGLPSGSKNCPFFFSTHSFLPSRTHWPFKKGLTNARPRGFELQSSELWGSKNDPSAQFQIQLIGFVPNLSHFSALKFLYKKHVFRSFRGLSGVGAIGSTKGCVRVCHYKMQCMTQVIQKLGHHVWNLCFCDIVGERNSEHGFLELGWNLTMGQKEQELSRMG